MRFCGHPALFLWTSVDGLWTVVDACVRHLPTLTLIVSYLRFFVDRYFFISGGTDVWM